MLINRKLITYGINYIKTAGLAAAFIMVFKVLSGRVSASKLDSYTSSEITSMSSFLEKAMSDGGSVLNMSLIDNARKSSFAAVCLGKGWSQEDSIVIADALVEKGLVPVFISCSSLRLPDTVAGIVIKREKSGKLISASSSVFSCIFFAGKVSERQVLQLSGKRVPVVCISGKKKKADNLIKYENNIHFVHKGKAGNRDLPIDTVSNSVGNWLLEVSRIIDLFVYVVPNELTKYDGMISVVIPTYNGKNDLQALVPALKSQKLVNSIQIVVVDSGSTDGTLEYLSNEAGVEIFCIPHESFSHSYARNYGFSKAVGEYVLFMTQDAMPTDDLWIRKIVDPLLKNGLIVASSCKQVPKRNCDCYGAYSLYFHNRFMGLESADRIAQAPKNRSDHTLYRKNAQLDDVACIIRSDVFDKYHYDGEYAEDLSLGLRLLNDGYFIIQRVSLVVVHSHNRSDYYHFQRAIIDNIWMNKLFRTKPNVSDEIQEIAKIVCLFCYSSDLMTNILSCNFLSFNELKSRLPELLNYSLANIKKKTISELVRSFISASFFSPEIKAMVKNLSEFIPARVKEFSLCSALNINMGDPFIDFFHSWTEANGFSVADVLSWVEKSTSTWAGAEIGNCLSSGNNSMGVFSEIYRLASGSV